MLLSLKMQDKFTWVLENFSSLQDEEYSRPFTFAGCNWRLLAYPRGVRNGRYGCFSVYLDLAPGSLQAGWRREVKFRITLVNVWPQLNKVLGGQCCFDAKSNKIGFEDFLPLYKLRNKWAGFLVNDRLTIVAEVHVFPAFVVPLEPVKIIASLSSKEINQASVSKSQGDSPCQVAQETDNATSQENLDDDDAFEEGTDDDDDASEEDTDDDDDDASEEDTDDDDDDASEESTNDDDDDDTSEESLGDDDANQEDPDDGAASSPIYDNGGSGISPLNQSNGLEDASHTVVYHGIRCNSVAAEPETVVSNGENDDAPKENVDDEASSLVLNDSARSGSTLDQVKSLEDASQVVIGNGGRGFNTEASVTATSKFVLKEVQPVKETMDINGFEVVSSKVESVRRIFERHPDIAVQFRAKNQHLRNACMNFLLSLIETMCQSLQELSNEDLVEADIALTYLRDAGFKVDWLEKKLDQLKERKEEEQSGLARLHEIEENLLILKQKWSDLDALAEKEKAELSATRTSMSFDDLVS